MGYPRRAPLPSLLLAPSLQGSGKEKTTTIERGSDGSLTTGATAEGEESSSFDGQKTVIPITEKTEAVVHSHPGNIGVEPGYESKTEGDHVAVESAGVPNYVTKGDTVIAIEKSGGQYRARVVSGSITREEAKLVQKSLDDFQRAGRR